MTLDPNHGTGVSPRYFDIDYPLVATGIVEAERNQVMHALVAHVCQVHGWPRFVASLHRNTQDKTKSPATPNPPSQRSPPPLVHSIERLDLPRRKRQRISHLTDFRVDGCAAHCLGTYRAFTSSSAASRESHQYPAVPRMTTNATAIIRFSRIIASYLLAEALAAIASFILNY
jgi:hypothetical protein